MDDIFNSTEFSRPIVTTRPSPVRKRSAPSPVLMIVVPLSLVSLLLLGVGGYFAFSWLGSSETIASAPGTANGATSASTEAATNTTSSVATVADKASGGASGPDVASNPSPAAQPARPSSSPIGSSPPSTSPSSTSPSFTSPATTSPAQPAAQSIANSSEASAASLADVIERSEKSVVRIEVVMAEGKATGSGFVVDSAGTIVTNCHVLAGADSAIAYFPDGRQANILGTKHIEQSKDIVIAVISDTSAPAIALASVLPRKGERVTALGAPHGLSFTATTGIVSAIRAGNEIDESHQGTWIQVDAAISPGNSGGPLINANGEVVGMSTLASQGTAQNLNFGISCTDISEAIIRASSSAMLALSTGVGKVQMEDMEEAGSSPVDEAKITDEAFAAYVTAGAKDFDELLKGLRNESTRMSLDLKEMRKGENRLPLALQGEDMPLARIAVPGQRTPKWFFQSESVKQAVIEQQIERIKVLTKLKTEIRDKNDPESLYSLLWNHGPPLSVRRHESIGYAEELIVVHAFDDHVAMVVLEETMYLLWAPSTAGMSAGEILEGPVYVAGTATAKLRSGIPMAVTVLQLVSEKQLRNAVEKATQSVDGYRVWKDKTGGFALEAKLLGQDATKVVLQKRDGTIVNVPLEKLSDADIAFAAAAAIK